jgi:hypothetical protein
MIGAASFNDYDDAGRGRPELLLRRHWTLGHLGEYVR